MTFFKFFNYSENEKLNKQIGYFNAPFSASTWKSVYDKLITHFQRLCWLVNIFLLTSWRQVHLQYCRVKNFMKIDKKLLLLTGKIPKIFWGLFSTPLILSWFLKKYVGFIEPRSLIFEGGLRKRGSFTSGV